MVGASQWTSLEVTKLVVAAATPVLLFVLGLMVTRAARRVEDAQWKNRKVIERRLELYNEMAPKLNDLLCFFLRVGHYKEIAPPDAIARKRALDRTFHANAPLFDLAFATRYQAFIDTCFLPFQGAGHDAKLRAYASAQELERAGSWKPEWRSMFAHGSEAPEEDVAAAYDRLMHTFAEQVGVRAEAPRPRQWLSLYSKSDAG